MSVSVFGREFRKDGSMLSLYEVSEMKEHLTKQNGAIIHLHDTCGGQYFTIEDGNTETENIISDFLIGKNQKVFFSEDKLSFIIG